MSARKPTPYSSFSAYNKFEVEQKHQQDEVQKRQQQMSQHVSKNSPMNQANIQMNQQFQSQQGQNQSQQGQNQLQQGQNQLQQGQFQLQQGQSRFKHIPTSENLYSILTTGLDQFQNNFKAKNMQPPPMRIFLKLHTEWCGPCKKIGPILDEISLSPDMKDIIFMKFDADLMIKGQDQHSKELSKLLKVGAVPAMFGFIDGKLVGNVMGADINEITGLLNKLAQF
jgi:thiol-disulfide isomerase/thioredoxin